MGKYLFVLQQEKIEKLVNEGYNYVDATMIAKNMSKEELEKDLKNFK